MIRLASLNSSHPTDLQVKLDELELLGYKDVGVGTLEAESFRIIAITAPGFEYHTLLEVCVSDKGYTCYHYDPDGSLVGEKYVES